MGEKAAGGTALVLEALKQNQAHATFLLTGQWAEANPSLVKEMVSEGYELGNHSYDHPDFTQIGEAQRVSQLERTEAIAKQIIGRGLKPYFRPPFGAYNDAVRATLASHGYHMLYWTLDSADWRAEMQMTDVVERVVAKAGPGDIVVFHGYAEKTAKALPLILPRLKAKKMCFHILSEVL
jgi:peptidoglycan-N-acetylglucosamine deacetylase